MHLSFPLPSAAPINSAASLRFCYGEPLTLDEFRDKKLTTELMGEITKVIMDKVEELKVKE